MVNYTMQISLSVSAVYIKMDVPTEQRNMVVSWN